MDQEKILRAVAEASKSGLFNDRLQDIVDADSDMTEEELDAVAGGIQIPEFKPE